MCSSSTVRSIRKAVESFDESAGFLGKKLEKKCFQKNAVTIFLDR